MWINELTNLDNVYYLTVTRSGGTYTVEGQVEAFYGQSAFGLSLATFGSWGAVQSALDDFLAVVGQPWVAIGDASGIGSGGDPVVIAVNMDRVVQMADNTSGVKFGAGWTSVGFAPWSDYSSAVAALMAVAGNIDFG